ncbi:phage portal protein [Paenibacillus pasadenensis]|uniref:phage tail assembly chaperone n=1 Tax=Paenibacillus pasadenensis TaxID=217090 RepID=UPI00203DC1DE|nr:phage portal protein [Paenibacillus pasadenensis]MCM3747458.1 phage portal protein [Paenibacillus pasadenensis]
MNKNMAFFMKGRAKQEYIEEEVVITKRFLDDKGEPIPFVLRSLPPKRIEEIQEDCTRRIVKKGRVVDEILDSKRMAVKMALESTVFPDFRSAELLESYGVVDPVEAARAVLSVGGEYTDWINAVNRVNGYGDQDEDLVEEAKN